MGVGKPQPHVPGRLPTYHILPNPSGRHHWGEAGGGRRKEGGRSCPAGLRRQGCQLQSRGRVAFR